MILLDLKDIDRFKHLDSKSLIYEALKWTAEHVNDTFEKGSIMIADGQVKVNKEEVAMMPPEKKMLEAHKKFIDIHIPLSEDEYMGWSHISYLKNIIEQYDEEKDIEFYGDAAQNIFKVARHQAVIFFPEDAHAPNVGIGLHHKLCIKIPVLP